MKFRLSDDYCLDSESYAKEGLRIAILAMSGAGKSYAGALIIEDALAQGLQTIVIEPIAEWHTLKAHFKNVVVVGGEYQDLPLETKFANEYVKRALENNLSLVLNVGDIETESDQIKFVADFLWSLYRLEQKYRRAIFLLIEEADLFAPQMWDSISKPSLARISMIAKHGRKLGIFPILISQRPSDIHKSPLSQANVILFGKFTSSADLNPKTGVMFLAKKLHIPLSEKEVTELRVGEFIAWDRFGIRKIKLRKRLCPHGADTPLISPLPLAPETTAGIESLSKLIQKALEEKRKEKSLIEKLQTENEQLKKRVEELTNKLRIKLSLKEMLEGTKITNSDREALANIEQALMREKEKAAMLEAQLKQYRDAFSTIYQAFSKVEIGLPKIPAKSQHEDLISKLDPYDRKIYEYLVSKKGIPITFYQLGVACGVSTKSSRFFQAIRTLKKLGLVREEGKFSLVVE